MVYERLVLPLLFAWSHSDPEEAHILAKRVLQKIQDSPGILALVEKMYKAKNNPNPVTVAGITFPNRVGLAAGFDKNAEVVVALQALGFGFIEVGTVLPRPQAGNDRPRMFRFPEHQALLNRMGFNSSGRSVAWNNLYAQRGRICIPLGISLGIMKDTPPEKAANDYQTVLGHLRGYASYFAINVSSPNTPGLRDLQGEKYLENLVRACVVAENTAQQEKKDLHRPIFVKIAPDLSEKEIVETLEAAVRGGAAGIIATNTTVSLDVKRALGTRETGGVSGKPLFLQALSVVKQVRRQAPKLPIMGVGGISSKENAEIMFDEGADVVQIYASFIYQGPRLVTDIRSMGRRMA